MMEELMKLSMEELIQLFEKNCKEAFFVCIGANNNFTI